MEQLVALLLTGQLERGLCIVKVLGTGRQCTQEMEEEGCQDR